MYTVQPLQLNSSQESFAGHSFSVTDLWTKKKQTIEQITITGFFFSYCINSPQFTAFKQKHLKKLPPSKKPTNQIPKTLPKIPNSPVYCPQILTPQLPPIPTPVRNQAPPSEHPAGSLQTPVCTQSTPSQENLHHLQLHLCPAPASGNILFTVLKARRALEKLPMLYHRAGSNLWGAGWAFNR